MIKIVSIALNIVFLVVPVLSVSIYQGFISTDRYESSASAVITEQKSSANTFDLSFIGTSLTGSEQDSLIVQELILSMDMMNHLDEKIEIKSHYSNPEIDYFSRIDPDATVEDFHELYQDYVNVEYNAEDKILKISVQAFDKHYAQKMIDIILDKSDQFIDEFNQKVNAEQIRFFEEEKNIREKNMIEIKEKILQFQKENKVFTTESESQNILAIIGVLENSLSQKKSELDSKQKVLSRDSAILEELRNQIDSLENQIALEKERLTSSDVRNIGKIQSDFSTLEFQLEIATEAFKSTLATLEQIKVESSRKLKFIVVVTQPSLAQKSTYPRRWYIVISTILISLAVYGVARLIASTIREHI